MKNANSRSHLRKINEKVRQKLGRHTFHSLHDAVAREINTAHAGICAQNQW